MGSGATSVIKSLLDFCVHFLFFEVGSQLVQFLSRIPCSPLSFLLVEIRITRFYVITSTRQAKKVVLFCRTERKWAMSVMIALKWFWTCIEDVDRLLQKLVDLINLFILIVRQILQLKLWVLLLLKGLTNLFRMMHLLLCFESARLMVVMLATIFLRSMKSIKIAILFRLRMVRKWLRNRNRRQFEIFFLKRFLAGIW